MKPVLHVKASNQISDDEMTYLLMGLMTLEKKFEVKLDGHEGSLEDISNRIMLKQMEAKL